jgi:hypothetical protein
MNCGPSSAQKEGDTERVEGERFYNSFTVFTGHFRQLASNNA